MSTMQFVIQNLREKEKCLCKIPYEKYKNCFCADRYPLFVKLTIAKTTYFKLIK